MSYINEVRVKYADSGAIDAFNRLRTAQPYTIFDSKQLYDKDPNNIVWDEVTSGGGETSTHSTINAAVTMTVAANNEYVIRQTKMRFNYQPGKSQLFFLTGVMSSEASVTKRLGSFHSSTSAPYTPVNGVYLENDGTNVSLNIVKNGVVNKVNQSSWNVDTMDGNGPTGINLNFAKAQIFIMDWEWLGVGRIRCGFVIDGIAYYAHYFNHANSVTSVYMSTPNLPLRYEIRSTGGSGSMQHICAAVHSEGGIDPGGAIRAITTGIDDISITSAGNGEALIGIRLKSTHLGKTIVPLSSEVMCTANAYYRWYLTMNPTISNSVSWTSLNDSAIEYAIGSGSNTISNVGLIQKEGFGSGSIRNSSVNLESSILLGTKVNGTRDQLWLCAQAFSTNENFVGALNWREL